MKNLELKDIKGIIFILIVLILTAISAYPQQRFAGTITEVVDGKTFVMQTVNGKITCVLQYIEVPEPEQPLHQTVKEHLEKVIINQRGEFKPLAIMKDRTVGQLIISGVDISQQMLRDGAAWYSGNDKFDQNALYLNNESQAKAEKRGVWGIANLKPAWEFRAEKEKSRQTMTVQNQVTAKDSTPTYGQRSVKRQISPIPQMSYDSQSESWERFESERSLPQGVTVVGGLWSAQDPTGKFGLLATPPTKLYVESNNDVPVIVLTVLYMYAQDKDGELRQLFIIGFESYSEKVTFLKNNNLIITIDKQKFNAGKMRRVERKISGGYKEMLEYQIKRDVLEKIANAKEVKWQIGDYKGTVDGKVTVLLQNMMAFVN